MRVNGNNKGKITLSVPPGEKQELIDFGRETGTPNYNLHLCKFLCL